jgi:hypothetical protein
VNMPWHPFAEGKVAVRHRNQAAHRCAWKVISAKRNSRAGGANAAASCLTDPPSEQCHRDPGGARHLSIAGSGPDKSPGVSARCFHRQVSIPIAGNFLRT